MAKKGVIIRAKSKMKRRVKIAVLGAANAKSIDGALVLIEIILAVCIWIL
jgi:hypothetical protein